MNERIKELMVKCNYVVDGTCDISREQKFAELIVKECEVALKPPVQVRDVISRGQAYDLIKKHFGVEE
jgi:hypothetical protein